MAETAKKTFFQKLLELQKKGLKITKNGKNPFTKSNYATLDDINEAYKPALSELGLLVYHTMGDGALITHIQDADDETKSIDTFFTLSPVSDPQKMGSQITYAKRYNLGQLLNIVTDDDDDAEGAKGGDVKQDLQWFNDKELGELKKAIEDGKYKVVTIDTTFEEIKKKYKISKTMEEKIKEIITTTSI